MGALVLMLSVLIDAGAANRVVNVAVGCRTIAFSRCCDLNLASKAKANCYI